MTLLFRKNKCLQQALVISLLLSSSFLRAESFNGKIRLAVIGDSMATGVFTDTQLYKGPESFLNSLKKVKASDLDFERIEETYFKLQEYAARPESAALTSKGWGLPFAIANFHNVDPDSVQVQAFAVNGASYRNVKEQIAKIPSERFHYIVMMLGANDVCRSESAETFKTDVSQAIKELRAKFPEAVIIVPLIPQIQSVKEFDPHFDIKFDIFSLKLSIPVQMSDIRRDMCRGIFDNENAEDLIREYNEIITELASAYKSRQLILIRDTADLRARENTLAFDGFHLNEAGQKELGSAINREWQEKMNPVKDEL